MSPQPKPEKPQDRYYFRSFINWGSLIAIVYFAFEVKTISIYDPSLGSIAIATYIIIVYDLVYPSWRTMISGWKKKIFFFIFISPGLFILYVVGGHFLTNNKKYTPIIKVGKKLKGELPQKNKSDTLTKFLVKIDTVREPNNPVLYCIPESTKLVVSSGNKIGIHINAKCLSKSVAYIIGTKTVVFMHVKNNLVEIAKNHSSDIYNSTDVLNIYLEQGLAIPKEFNYSDTLFYLFRVNYSDKPLNGVIREPFRKLYFVTFEHAPQEISDVKLHNLDDQDLYRSIKRLLIKQRLW